MLLPRIITALVLVALFLATLFAQSPLLFCGFGALMVMVAAWEWAAFAEFGKLYQRGLFVAAITVVLLLTFLMSGLANAELSGLFRGVLYFAALFWLGVLLLVLRYPKNQRLWDARLFRLLLGAVLLVLAWAALLYLRYHSHGQFWVLYVVAVVAAADVGAYFFGKLFGRRKLAVDVSPGKSWEGFIGGVVTSQLLALGLYLFMADKQDNPLPSLLGFLLVTALLAGSSVLGDLFESMLKRRAGLKDSGTILPGHGGVMDRIDGLAAALPMLALVSMSLDW